MPHEAAAQMGPDYWQVHGVASNDTLNIRSGPGTGSRVVVRAPNGAVFRNLGCRGTGNDRWCHLETPDGQVSGWAAGRFLRESGAPSGGGSGGGHVPELNVRHSGEVEVGFSSGCTVLFNPIGRRINAGSSCSRTQLAKAQDAVDRFMSENSPGAGSSAAAVQDNSNLNVDGTGMIYGGASISGRIYGHKEGAYALLISGDMTCTGLLQHAPGVVKSETASVHCTDGSHGTAILARNRSGNGSTLTFTLTDGTGGYVIFQ